MERKILMKQLTNDEISKNHVETINQFKVLEYLKKNLDVFSFQIFLYDKDTVKVIDKEEKLAYFRYDEDTKDVLFIEASREYEKGKKICSNRDCSCACGGMLRTVYGLRTRNDKGNGRYCSRRVQTSAERRKFVLHTDGFQ